MDAEDDDLPDIEMPDDLARAARRLRAPGAPGYIGARSRPPAGDVPLPAGTPHRRLRVATSAAMVIGVVALIAGLAVVRLRASDSDAAIAASARPKRTLPPTTIAPSSAPETTAASPVEVQLDLQPATVQSGWPMKPPAGSTRSPALTWSVTAPADLPVKVEVRDPNDAVLSTALTSPPGGLVVCPGLVAQGACAAKNILYRYTIMVTGADGRSLRNTTKVLKVEFPTP